MTDLHALLALQYRPALAVLVSLAASVLIYVLGEHIHRNLREGITLTDNGRGTHIGYNTKENVRAFYFDPDDKPALLVAEGESLSELENVPAIRRIQR